MAKLLLLSVLIAMVVLPILAARAPHPRRGLKRAVVSVVFFNFCYLLAILVGYLHLYLKMDLSSVVSGGH